ncbi:MAG: type III pantothenate kinase [Oscillospiraceae bacterium]|nr:type III pantothenate kinase [Oscillospiraceae bacterium]
MLLTIDIGNTNITIGGYIENSLVLTARLATDTRRTADQYAVEIRDILHIYGYSYKQIDDVIICSVVPIVARGIENAFKNLCNIEPIILGPGVKTGLNIKIDNPAQLGGDLAAGAVGALAIYKMPCIIIDLGTASTISVLGGNGDFLGGAIAAGINLTSEALAQKTTLLPMVSIEAPENVIGTNTVDSMKSGLVIGAAAMLDGMISRIEKQLGETASVVATGGLAKEVLPFCERKIIFNDTLLLDGLKIIYNKNKKKKN